MESLLKNLKEHVTCSICLDTFTEPKTIACLHTFCCECLKRHALTTQREGKFRCPECQAQVGVPERFDQLPTGFLQNSLLGILAVQQSGDGSEISCGSCRKKSAETSFCFNCGKFLCPDCVNAHELLRNVAFDGHKVRAIKHFQAEDYEALLKRQSFCSQQYHEREVTRFFCLDCQTCVCQVCVVTDHRNHAIDPLDKAADIEKAKIMAGTELMKGKGNICSDVIREFEETILSLETNISTAKREVSKTAEQIITKVREREREAITALENTRVSRTEKLNSLKTEVQSLAKQINQAIEFAEYLVQRSSSSDILQSKKSLEKRFDDLVDLNNTLVPSLPAVSSFVKFFSASEPVTLGFIVTTEPVVEGLKQDFQAGVEAELIVYSKLTREAQGKFIVDVAIEPAKKVGSLVTCEQEVGNHQVLFTPKMPGSYHFQVTVDDVGNHSPKSIFTRHIQVKERRLKVVGELDLKGETVQSPSGIAVNSKGLIAVADCDGQCILLFDREGNYLRKFGGTDIGQLGTPSCLTFINDSEILVADQINHCIQQFNVHTGEVMEAFGKVGKGENPISVSMDSDGRVVVTDCVNSKIQVFTKEGEPVLSFRTSFPTKCISHQNTFIVTNSNNQCIKIFNSSGKFLRKIGAQGKGEGKLDWPRGFCIIRSGNQHNILVCDFNNQRIVQFTMEGFFTGKTVAKLQGPVGIATTPDGRILVSDTSAKKIYILR